MSAVPTDVSQIRRPFGLSRASRAELSPSQLFVTRLSVVTPPNSRYLAPRALIVNSTPLYVDLFCEPDVTRLSMTVLNPGFSVRSEERRVGKECGCRW